MDVTTLAGRLALVEKEIIALGLDPMSAAVYSTGTVAVHLREPRTTVADGELLAHACGVEVWDVRPFPKSEPPFTVVEGRAEARLNVRVFCYETEPASATDQP